MALDSAFVRRLGSSRSRPVLTGHRFETFSHRGLTSVSGHLAERINRPALQLGQAIRQGILALTVSLCVSVSALAQADSSDSLTLTIAQPPLPASATNVRGMDGQNDDGGSIDVTWDKSSDDGAGLNNVAAYRILRSTSPDGPFDTLGAATAGQTRFTDANAQEGTDYFYAVLTVTNAPTADGATTAMMVQSDTSPSVRSTAQWFHTGRINMLIATLLLCGSVIYFIGQAKAGKPLFIRKIAGLEAVDEAVGRATEMGRKIMYVCGTQDMNEVQTLAGITILGRVAKVAAEYDAILEVPTSRAMVMVACRETVKEAYLNAGRPDAYREDRIFYVTEDQFGFAAGIDGIVTREKPATMFFMGAFYAESLILAETGNSVGAIQIAGTAMPAQLPFFVAACDYTLIGEELFAASAYLSKEPKLLGSLKGQDVGKAIILATILLGIVLTSIGAITLKTSDLDKLGWYNIGRWFEVR